MIRLEYFDKNDFEQLIAWIDSDYLITNWAGAMFRFPLTHESLDWYLDETNDTHSDAFVYKAIDTVSGKTIGHISLGSISEKNKSARVSRVLIGSDAQRGKGYCQAMMTAVLKIGFDEMNLHRISLGVYDFNTAAIRCYEKCGFKKEGLLRDVLKYEDRYWSLCEMGILDHEWRRHTGKET